MLIVFGPIWVSQNIHTLLSAGVDSERELIQIAAETICFSFYLYLLNVKGIVGVRNAW